MLGFFCQILVLHSLYVPLNGNFQNCIVHYTFHKIMSILFLPTEYTNIFFNGTLTINLHYIYILCNNAPWKHSKLARLGAVPEIVPLLINILPSLKKQKKLINKYPPLTNENPPFMNEYIREPIVKPIPEIRKTNILPFIIIIRPLLMKTDSGTNSQNLFLKFENQFLKPLTRVPGACRAEPSSWARRCSAWRGSPSPPGLRPPALKRGQGRTYFFFKKHLFEKR